MNNKTFYKIENWETILEKVKHQYNQDFSELKNYFNHVKKMMCYSVYTQENLIPKGLKDIKIEVYNDLSKKIKKHLDFEKVKKWLHTTKGQQKEFIEFIIDLDDKELACMLIYEKVYNPITEKRLDWEYRKLVAYKDWYKTPISFTNLKKTCYSCGHKYFLQWKTYHESRKDIVSRECPNCNFSKDKMLNQNLNIWYHSGVERLVTFQGDKFKINNTIYSEPPVINEANLKKDISSFKKKIYKIISDNLEKKEISIKWTDNDKYDKWFTFLKKTNKKLSHDENELLQYLIEHPNQNDINKVANKYINSYDLYDFINEFIKPIEYDIIDIESLSNLIFKKLSISNIKDSLLKKISSPFSLFNWIGNDNCIFDNFPCHLPKITERNYLVNEYFLNYKDKFSLFEVSQTVKVKTENPKVQFKKNSTKIASRISVNMSKNPDYQKKGQLLYHNIQSVNKDVFFRKNQALSCNVWQQADGSLNFTITAVDDIVASKKISISDFPEDTRETIYQFQSAMNDINDRDSFFKLSDDEHDINDNHFDSNNDNYENPFNNKDDDIPF
ncbi:hypothetical protein [Aquimarina agarilytica]|uniref:hypothetical protein n=1 Tax=Aquimarina agarilytica TaxID=1087449 RepID=UPI00028A0F69|nr:hypothetical protein [Aquimarina agarilytica]